MVGTYNSVAQPPPTWRYSCPTNCSLDSMPLTATHYLYSYVNTAEHWWCGPLKDTKYIYNHRDKHHQTLHNKCNHIAWICLCTLVVASLVTVAEYIDEDSDSDVVACKMGLFKWTSLFAQTTRTVEPIGKRSLHWTTTTSPNDNGDTLLLVDGKAIATLYQELPAAHNCRNTTPLEKHNNGGNWRAFLGCCYLAKISFHSRPHINSH